jgi:hypothetical protein
MLLQATLWALEPGHRHVQGAGPTERAFAGRPELDPLTHGRREIARAPGEPGIDRAPFVHFAAGALPMIAVPALTQRALQADRDRERRLDDRATVTRERGRRGAEFAVAPAAGRGTLVLPALAS